MSDDTSTPRTGDGSPSKSDDGSTPETDEISTSAGHEAVDDPTVTGAERAGSDDEEMDVPDWDDEYVDRVSGRLLYNYDLEKDREVAGETFDLYGKMEIHTQKHFLHQSLSYAEHDAAEHLFAERVDGVSVADVERYVQFCHDLADEWVDASEEHYGTDFSVVLIAPHLRDDVRSFVSGFKDRTMLKYGYYGHYEVNLVVVAPGDEEIVTSRSTGLDRAFALWESPEEESPGLLGRLF